MIAVGFNKIMLPFVCTGMLLSVLDILYSFSLFYSIELSRFCYKISSLLELSYPSMVNPTREDTTVNFKGSHFEAEIILMKSIITLAFVS